MATSPINISKELFVEIKTYCEVNNKDLGVLVNKLLREAFTIEKFGVKPNTTTNRTEAPKTDVVTTNNDANENKTEIKEVPIQDITDKIGIFGKDIYGE